MKQQSSCLMAGLLLLAVLAGTARGAGNGTWTQTTGGTYNWSDPGNWSGGTVAGGTAGNTATLTANLGGDVTINLGSPITLGTLTIGDASAPYCGYTINPNGGSFILDDTDDAVTISKSAASVDAVDADIALSDNLTISVAVNPSTLHLGGVISGVSKSLTYAPSGTGRILALTGNNTYSGKTTVSGGNLLINSMADADGTPSALGAPANAADGTIDLGSANANPVLLKYIGTGHSSNRRISLFGQQDMTLEASGSGILTLTSDLTAPNTVAKTLTLTGTGEGVLQGAIPNTDGAGAVSLSMTGTGTWTLKGSNTFAGIITVNGVGGTLAIGHDNALSTNALTLTAGKLAAVGGSRTITNSITSIPSVFGFSGSEDLSLTATIPAGDKTIYNTLTAGKRLTLAAVNIADGQNRRMNFAGTGDTTITGPIANGGAGTGTVLKAGSGTLTLTGANSYSGTTFVQGGTLLVDYATGSLPASGPLSFGSSSSPFANRGYGTLTLQGASGVASAQTLGTLTMQNSSGPGAGILRLVGVGGGSMTLTLSNAWNRTTEKGTSLHLDMSSGASTLTSSPQLNYSIVGGNIGYAFVTVADATGTGFATVSGGNVVRYAAATTLAAGSDNSTINYKTKVGDPGYAGSTLTLTAATPVNANTLELDTSAGSGVLDLSTKTLVIDMYGLLVTGNNGFTITNGTLGGGSGMKELMIHHYGTGVLTISAAAGSGSGFIAKTGPGTLVLSGASTANGTTRVNQGVLRLQHATGGGTNNIAVQAGAALELDGVAVGDRPLPVLSGDGIATNGALRCIATSTYGGLITVVNQGGRIGADSGTTLTLTNGIAVTLAGEDVTFGGAGTTLVSTVKITGAGGVIKDGAGTTELSAANDYTGATTVNGGTLKVSGSIASGSAVTVNTNGTLTGGGTCSGAVRVNSGGTVTALANGAAGDKLTVGSLILDAGGISRFDVASGNNADYIDVTTNGTLFSTAGLTIHPGAKVHLSAPNVAGRYNLIKYAGTLKGSVSNLSVANPAAGGTYVFSSAGGYVVLQATVSASGTMVMVR